MALSATQITQIFALLGIPEDGNPQIVHGLISLFGPAFEGYDCASIVTYLNAKLAAVSETQQAEIEILLTRLSTLTTHKIVKVKKSGTVEGDLSDYEKERQKIRDGVGNILGFAVPTGGFMAEVKRHNATRLLR
jgi:hypothetical protein